MATVTAVNAASIAACSILGVATRVAITYWFSRCPVVADDEFHPEALCITSAGDTRGGALFTSLPGNMLACFIMGLVVPSTLFPESEHGNPQPVALLPKAWHVQWYAPLWLGIRTGYCGSLSTFASWNMQMVEMITEFHVSPMGGQVAAALFGYFIGVALSVSMIMLGIHVAGAVYCGRIGKEADALGAASVVRQARDGELINTVRLNDTPNDTHAQATNSCVLYGMPSDNAGDEAVGHAADPRHAADDDEHDASGGAGLMACSPNRVGDACIVLLLATVVLVSALLAVFVPSLRVNALACIAGPLGAWLRWYLSSFNGMWDHKPWFPVGTFTANVLASVADALLKGLAFHFTGLGFVAMGAINVLVTGVSGSLSTVSSMASEKVVLLSLPTVEIMKAYQYVLATVAVSVALGIAAYGPFVWTAGLAYG